MLVSVTIWEVKHDGEASACIVRHNRPDFMDTCGPGEVFTANLTGQTGLNYTSSLRAEDVPLSLNGTIVECLDIDLQIIGSVTICIVGKSLLRCVFISKTSTTPTTHAVETSLLCST